MRGLAHITGDGLLNLLRLEAEVGYRIDSPLPVPPVFDLIAARGETAAAELYEVFNMGCGFCCVVPASRRGRGGRAARRPPPGQRGDRLGHRADGVVELPSVGLTGRRGEGFVAG